MFSYRNRNKFSEYNCPFLLKFIFIATLGRRNKAHLQCNSQMYLFSLLFFSSFVTKKKKNFLSKRLNPFLSLKKQAGMNLSAMPKKVLVFYLAALIDLFSEKFLPLHQTCIIQVKTSLLNDKNSVTECKLSKLADYTKLSTQLICWRGGMPSRGTLRDLRSECLGTSCNSTKWSGQSPVWTESVEGRDEEQPCRGLGDEKLNMSQQCALAA